jgi:ABC-2 type transport system permease protein
MKKIIRKASAFFSVYYAYMLEYRAELLFWVLAGSLPLILMGIWMEAAQGGQFGLTPVELARYFLTVFLVRQFTMVWVIWDFEREVLQGQLSTRLLQPIDPVWHYVAGHFSERFARLPFAIALVGLFFFLYPQAFWIPSLWRILLFGVAIAIAFAMRFLIQYTFAMFAFWIERAVAIEQFWFLIYLFLSGIIAPLELFPPEVREIVLWTPFPYIIHFPAAILVGLPVDIARGFLAILGWVVIFFLLNRWLWKKGLKHYSGMGA